MSNITANHILSTPKTSSDERPSVPKLTPDDFVKARYSHGNKHCYTARMLETFLPVDGPHYVLAYREFRLATMDYLYHNHGDDHADSAEARCKCWNTVATMLGYFVVDVRSIHEFCPSCHSDERKQVNVGDVTISECTWECLDCGVSYDGPCPPYN